MTSDNEAIVTPDEPHKARSLSGYMAVVTGASSGIGRAIALALSRQGAQLCIVGRDTVRLAETAAAARQFSTIHDFRIDLRVEQDLRPLLQHIENVGKLDILIHSAGVIHHDPMEYGHIANLDFQYAVNVRAPYVLTQLLLPMLTTARGQIVFMNSSLGLTTKDPNSGQYGATKHALRAIADSLREEVNRKGIRVLTLYVGRTATPMQESVHRKEGKIYRPESLLQPDDVASVVLHALTLPRTAELTDISIRPMSKV